MITFSCQQFDYRSSMGANFINSVPGTVWLQYPDNQKLTERAEFTQDTKKINQIVMTILSTFTPDCIVSCCGSVK